MRSLTQLDPDALKVARESAETLMTFTAYLPPGGLLLILLSKFRDVAGEMLDLEREPLPLRGRERRSLDELTSQELDRVAGATGILLQGRFTSVMGDPALPRLLREFHRDLNRQQTERVELRASIGTA